LTLTSPAGCGRSVRVVRLRTKTTKFFLVVENTEQRKNWLLNKFKIDIANQILQKKLLEKGGWDFSEILAITMKEEMFEKI
jgi:hypothetical protein